ncbi:hypothetical protein ABT298_30870 [Streptomyces sp. NPDC001034]|uniref:hypothetical protein n=1 Tax=Streptomyces sp. NPDC001034 TaxID=3154375 RepID=UPI00331D23F3
MSEISDVSDVPSPTPPSPPSFDSGAVGDGDVPEEDDAGAGTQDVGQAGTDDADDGDVPEPERTTDGPATGADELTDGDVDVREAGVERPVAEPASAGRQPPDDSEPLRPVAAAEPPDKPDSAVPPDPVVAEEQRKEPGLPDNQAASETTAVENSPAPADHLDPLLKSESGDPEPSLESESSPEPGTAPADPAGGPFPAREAAERPERIEAADEVQGGADEPSAGTASPDRPVGPEEEPAPLEQADTQQPAAPEASTDMLPDPDRAEAGETDEVRAADTVPVSDEPGAGPADEAEPAEESDRPAEARLGGDVGESSTEAGNSGQVADGAESGAATGATGDSRLEEKEENAATGTVGDDTRPQEPQDGISQGDPGQRPPLTIQERIRQAIGAGRNWANDTYLGRRLTGRPMEPWKSNRALHRSLNGARPPENAVVADLEELGRGNGTIGYKDVNAKRRSDDDLINSVFAPRDGQYISTYVGNPGVIGQGNHRAEELLKRAKDPDNENIEMNTPIFIHRVGETETGTETGSKGQA